MTVRFRVKELLDEHHISTYRLWRASGLSQSTVYAIAQGKMDGAQFDTLARLLAGLEQLLGRPVNVNEVLEVVR